MRATPAADALIYDAQSYYNQANTYLSDGFFADATSNNSSFIDSGYPLVLSLAIKLFGFNNIVSLQILNYVFWIFSSWLVYLSLLKMKSKYPGQLALLMLFSPLLMTFSAKIYSEPYAALGVSLLIYANIHLINEERFTSHLAILFGSFILFTTKSIFILFVPVMLAILLIKKRWIGILYLLISVALLSPFLLSSSKGGRSIYNLAIQSSKIEQSYDQIFACAPYYLSYPLGKLLLPRYEAVCRHNDPDPVSEGYDANPYVLAVSKREDGFDYLDWLELVIAHPIKYSFVIIVSLTNIVFFEGVYPTILTKLPAILMIPIFVVCKIILSIYLWTRVFIVAKKESFWWMLPLIYFVVVVSNFPIESRYFYPLIPFMYFLAGLSYRKV